jgi:citrate synthase
MSDLTQISKVLNHMMIHDKGPQIITYTCCSAVSNTTMRNYNAEFLVKDFNTNTHNKMTFRCTAVSRTLCNNLREIYLATKKLDESYCYTRIDVLSISASFEVITLTIYDKEVTAELLYPCHNYSYLISLLQTTSYKLHS